jgi:hypothetical protein
MGVHPARTYLSGLIAAASRASLRLKDPRPDPSGLTSAGADFPAAANLSGLEVRLIDLT